MKKLKIAITILLWGMYLLCPAQDCVRIVSLSPSITATLQQLGADSCIVGRTSYCPAPLNGKTAVIVGNVLEISVEKIISLKPDLVFCMSFTKTEVRKQLEHMGIRVKDFSTPKSFAEICTQTREIGMLVDRKTAADTLVESEIRKVADIREEFTRNPPVPYPTKTFFQIGINPLFPVIEGTYMNEYLFFLGLDNIIKQYKGGGISPEYVLASDPAILIISRMSGSGDEAVAFWRKFSHIDAVKNNRILLVDDTKACCPTPVFFRETLQTIAEFLKSIR